jgi:hypothetical protein
MKSTLVILLFSLIAISCGGSGSGGDDGNPGCGSASAACFDEKKPIGKREINLDEATKLVLRSANKIENIYPGMTFNQVYTCSYDLKQFEVNASDSIVKQYTVLSFDNDENSANYREVIYRVKVIKKPSLVGDESCIQEEVIDSEYTEGEYLPEGREVRSILKNLGILEFGTIIGEGYVLGTKEGLDESGDFRVKTTRGIGLGRAYPISKYLSVEAKSEDGSTISILQFAEQKADTDPNSL